MRSAFEECNGVCEAESGVKRKWRGGRYKRWVDIELVWMPDALCLVESLSCGLRLGLGSFIQVSREGISDRIAETCSRVDVIERPEPSSVLPDAKA